MSKIRLYGATSGYVDLAAPAVADDATLTLPTGAAGFGKVLQVVQDDKVGGQTSSLAAGATTQVTGLTASITPSSVDSKILVLVQMSISSGDANADETIGVILKRNGTGIGLGNASGSRTALTSATVGSTTHGMSYVGVNYLDSPNSTSAVTYTVDMYNGSSGTRTLKVNTTENTTDAVYNGRPSSNIILMEIGA